VSQLRPRGIPVTALVLAVTMLCASGVYAQETPSPTSEGGALYAERCATCHEAGVPRAANRATLARLSPESVRLALTEGSMRTQAASLNAQQRETLVSFLASGDAASSSANAAAFTCPAESSPFSASERKPHWNGWGAGLSQRRFQPASFARLSAKDVPRLKLKWAFGFEDAQRAYAQPTVMGGRIFVGSANKRVYSLSAASGCTYWAFTANAPVRTAITLGREGKRWIAYFGDQQGMAYAIDAANGNLLWKTRVDDHPGAMITGSPSLAGRTLYVPVSSTEEGTGAGPRIECCKFRGSVSALDAATGEILWKSYTISDEPKPTRRNAQGTQLWGPAGAGIWSSPTVDVKNKRVYVTTGDDYTDPASDASDAFVAFDAVTGRKLWTHQATAGDTYNLACDLPAPFSLNCPAKAGPDHDFGSSAMLVSLPKGRRALVAGQKSGVLHAIDPDNGGALLWKKQLSPGGKSGGIQWGSATDGERIYVAISDIKQTGAQLGTPGARPSMFGIPMRLDPNTGGGLFAIRLSDGETLWHTPHPGCNNKPGCSPAQSAAVTAIPGVVFSGSVDGRLRAYDAKTGRIIWDMDTAQEYQTVNRVRANGGSLDGPGPVVVGGVVYVNSGYLFTGSAPGNVLLAYSVDGN
jgi:polyvinyl alcohol dehydrogenase (cytochrome)